jgi:hypothetical protein
MGAHLFASAAFLIPILIHLSLMRFQGGLGPRRFVVFAALVLIAQFLMGLELLASIGIFGSIALGVAWAVWRDRRPDILHTALLILLASGIAALVLSPILVETLAASGMGRHRVWSDHGVDLLELVVPGHGFLVGQLFGFDKIPEAYDHFSRDLGGYVGLPIVIVAGLFFATGRGSERRRFFAAMLAITYIAALGPALHLKGHVIAPMPWRLFDGLPFINSAQAARFAVGVDLLLAIIVASWIAEAQIRPLVKRLIAAAIVFSILPNFLDRSLWVSDPRMPGFFSSGEFKNNLKPGENVLLLPYGAKGEAMAWQALSGMYFAMPEGWTGPTPPSVAAWPITDVFNYGVEIPEKGLQFEAFLAAHGTTAILIDRNGRDFAESMSLVDRAEARIEEIDGVIVARPSDGLLERFKQVTATEMQCRRDDVRVASLIAAANRCLHESCSIAQLTPRYAQDRGWLPPSWVEAQDRGIFTRCGFGLGPAEGGRVMIGVTTAAQCVAALTAKFGKSAEEVLFPAPHQWRSKRLSGSHEGKLILNFAPERLAVALDATHTAVDRGPAR